MNLKFLITNLNNIENVNLKHVLNIEEIMILSNFPIESWSNKKNEKFVLLGKIFEKQISKIKIKKLLENFESSKNLEGNFCIIKYSKNDFQIWSDKFSKRDLFYLTKSKKELIASSSLDILFNINNYFFKDIDQIGIAQSLIIYGARPSKKNTFYKNIKRLGYYEKLTFKNKKLNVYQFNYPIFKTENYKLDKMDDYYNHFISVLEKHSKKTNIIYLSSGWDSTSILAGLREIHDKSKIICVISKLNLSKKYGVVNDFELQKAKKFAKFYGVKLEVVENNTSEESFVEEYYPKVEKLFKPYNLNFFTGLNHYLLAEHVAKKLKLTNAMVFAGEMSDGAHNLGFSQYVTLFHPKSYGFREYSDKMMNYLFGPTFLNQIYENKHISDPVWKILKNENIHVDKINNLDRTRINFLLLRSFFVQSSRFPLTSLKTENILNKNGVKKYESYMYNNYLKTSAKLLNEDNFYSIFLNLYNSFHWQGSTVGTLGITSEHFGLNFCNPYNSIGIFDFLCKMPENWGRGLDLNSTKYPLKYILRNKLKYPIELQEGPHSYLYDIDSNINLLDEVLYNSGFTKYAKNKLSKCNLIKKIDNSILNKNYINLLTNSFLKGKKLVGAKNKDLGSIISNSVVDIY